MTSRSLYALSTHDPDVDVQRPRELEVRLTDGKQLDVTIVRVTVSEHGGIIIAVPDGVSVTHFERES